MARSRWRSIRSRLREFRDDIEENEAFMRIKTHLPPLNFITVHYAYFIATCMIASVIFWGSSNPGRSISYTDALFLVVSAMTEAGLNTVNLSQMTTFQQIILWLLILMGSSIFVSIGTVLARKHAFERRFKDLVESHKEQRKGYRRSMSMSVMGRTSSIWRPGTSREPSESIDISMSQPQLQPTNEIPRDEPAHTEEIGPSGEVSTTNLERAPTAPDSGVPGSAVRMSTPGDGSGVVAGPDADHIRFMTTSPSSEHRRVLTFVGVGAHPHSTSFRTPHTTSGSIYQRGRKSAKLNGEREDKPEEMPEGWYPQYLTPHTIGRNGQFFGLSKAERDHLGGVEYRAIQLLAWIVPIYFMLWQLIGCLALAAYIAHNKASVAYENGINPWWLGIFNGVSAFNNSGMSLLDANMIPFQTSTYTLLTMGLLILAGNTAYPLFLRLGLWSMLKILSEIYPSDDQFADYKATLRFILAYPRRVYTNLFPSAPTWWLLFMLVALNGVDWAAFELLNIGNKATSAIPTRFRVLDGLFQALAVRSGGFYVTSITSLRIGLQVLYVIMMYISVYPVVITMRHSNVYEERSLGIYADDEPQARAGPKLGTIASQLRRTLSKGLSTPFPTNSDAPQFVRQQIRGQLAHDLWWLVIAILLISCIEVGNFDRDPITYSVFNITFEVVSAYGCVGISPGLPNKAYSFSGGFHVCSKLIMCAVMLRGRHRGLPVALDRAVRLPGAGGEYGELEEEDWLVKRRRSMSVAESARIGLGLSTMEP